jgi:protoporphyrinogen oxidase
MGERVAVPNVARIRQNIAAARDDVSWGPNRTFRFPVHGGTGAIWRGVANRLPPDRLLFGARVAAIDLTGRRVSLENGREIPYDTLISTLPLDRCCRMASSLPSVVMTAAGRLRYSSVHVIGIGLLGAQPETLGRKCWMYFPESHSPYYRITVFSNYSPNNVPAGDYWSLMAEVCESPARPVDAATLVDDVVAAMLRDGLILPETPIVSRWHHREEHGYPTPFVGRDEVLASVRPVMEESRLFSRGRFGAWKYEVSNQDHSFMQGAELANRLVRGTAEVTVDDPNRANSGEFLTADVWT